MKTKTIRQTINLKANPLEVYEMLIDKNKLSEITNSQVKISRKIKGAFTVFDGYCTGYNITLIEGQKIMQAWRFEEDGWPKDHFSICTFLFNKTPTGTKLTFTQEGVPSHKLEQLKKGWHSYYWAPMKKFIDDHKHIL